MHPAEEARPALPRPSWVHLGLIVLAVAACYANSLAVPFLFDDPFLVAERPDVPLDYSTRPLVWASFDLNRALSGRDTQSYHAFNILVHLATGLLLLGILRRTVAGAAPGLAAATREGMALVTTLLWLCHPLQTESVTYLSQRAESLGACFTLASLYAFVRSTAAERPRGWQALAWLALALGLAAKETVATAPLLVWLYDAVFVARGPWQALRRRPLFHGGLWLLTVALASAFILPLLHVERLSAGFGLQEFGALDYARTQPGVILHYLRLAFWPHPLCFDYAWPIATAPGQFLPQALVMAALLAATMVLLVRRSWLGYAGAFFFVYLAPSSSFVPIRDAAVEHRVYLPLAAVALVSVVAARGLLARLAPRARALGPALAALAVLALGARTIRRNQDYRTSESLWRQTLEVAPHNARAHGNLGAALLEAGRFEESIASLMQALALAPEESFVLLDLGKAYWRQGDLARARSFLERGIARAPDARGLGSLGSLLFEQGDYAGAVLHFEEALALEPWDAGAHYRLANALAQGGRADEAVQAFHEALRLAPGFQEARINLAAVLLALGRTREALEQSEAALAQLPNTALELHNHARLVSQLGRHAAALPILREAVTLEPDMPEPHAALAEVVLAMPAPSAEELREALAHARRAVELTQGTVPEYQALLEQAAARAGEPPAAGPSTAEDYFALAQELRQLGRSAEAVAAFREARRLAPELPEPRIALAETLHAKPDASAEERREALEEARRAVELARPPRPEYLAVLALCQAAEGDLAGAIASLDAALALPAAPELAAQLRALRDDYLRRSGR